MTFQRMDSGMAERIVHCLAGDIELGSLKVGRVRFEVLYTTTRKGITGGGEGREEAVVWGRFIWIGFGEVGVVDGVGSIGGRMDGVFGGVRHSKRERAELAAVAAVCASSSRVFTVSKKESRAEPVPSTLR